MRLSGICVYKHEATSSVDPENEQALLSAITELTKNKTLIWKAAGQIEGVILFSKRLKGTWHYNLKGNKIIFEINRQDGRL